MNKGYTLLELLIAMTVTMIAILTITEFFISEHHIYKMQEAEAEMYQTLRGAMQMFTNEVILAGYRIPSTITGITKFKDDEIEFRTNLRDITSSLSSDASPGQNTLYVRSGTGKYFEKGDIIIIYTDINSNQYEEHVLSKDGNNNYITITPSLGVAFPSGSRIDLINTISYRYNQPKKELQRKIDNGVWESVAEHLADDGVLISYKDNNNNTPIESSDIRRIDITLTIESFRRESATSTITLRNYI